MAKIVSKGHKTWKDGSVMNYTIVGERDMNMNKKNVKLITVGSLLKDLKRFEKNHWDDCVVAWADDEDITLGIVGIGKDSDGDIKIMVEVDDYVLEGFWSVSDVISALENKDKQKKVYLKGGGGYLAIVSDGEIFTEADDDDVIGCYISVFGYYDEVEEPRNSKKNSKRLIENLALVLILLVAAGIIAYNIYAMIAGVGGPLLEKIFLIVGCSIAIVVGTLTLYYSKDE